MENILGSSKAIALIVTTFFIGSTSWLIVEKRSNVRLGNRLNRMELKEDSLSSVNDSLLVATVKFKKFTDTLLNKNDELDKSLSQTTSKLNGKEREVREGKASLQQSKTEYAKLLAQHSALEKQFNAVKTSFAQLQQDNKDLNNRLLSLGENNNSLSLELTKARQSSTDNVEIDALNKSGKLNPKARKVRKIVSTFSVQVVIKDPHFRIFDPTGKMLTEQDGSFMWHGSNTPLKGDGSNEMTNMEVTYLPTKRLTPGLYRIETLNDNLHVGSFLVRFR